MDATGQNMCEFSNSDLDDKWRVYYGAMNQADWNKAGGMDVCGKCIAVRGVPGDVNGGHKIETVIVKIVDQCPDWACDPGNVDFSTTALEAITGYDWDKKKITWDFVDCDSNPDAEAEAAKKAAAAAAAKKAAAAKAAAAKAAAAKEAAADAAAEKADIAAATDSIVSQAGAALEMTQAIVTSAATVNTSLDAVAENVAVQATAALDTASAAAGRRLSRRSL